MFKNYLKIAWRNIVRHKGYSFINIFGLAVGLACCILILLAVRFEMSFDRFHERADRIFRFTITYQRENQTNWSLILTGRLAAALKQEFSEIEEVARIFTYSWKESILLSNGDKNFYESLFFLVDPSFFSIFSFPFVKGDPVTAFAMIDSAVITEETAHRFFGDKDPLGKIISVKYPKTVDLRVTGVVRNPPASSHLHFDILAPLRLGAMLYWKNFEESNSFYTYVLLRTGVEPAALAEKFTGFLNKFAANRDLGIGSLRVRLALQPLTSIHLHSNLSDEIEANGSIQNVYFLLSLAIFILVIACINFVNLASARFSLRAREVSLRKVAGAERNQLVGQFLAESVLFSLLALPIALMLVKILLTAFTSLLGSSIDLGLFENAGFILVAIGLTIVTGLVSGIYPALMLSSFHTVRILKKGGVKHSSLIRNLLLVFQYSTAMVFVIGTLVVMQQMRYVKNTGVGFDLDKIVVIPVKDQEVQENYEAIRTEFQKVAGVEHVTGSDALPLRIAFKQTVWSEGAGADETLRMDWNGVNYDFLETYGMKIVSGRGFSRDHPADGQTAYIINETAARQLGWTEAPGKSFGLSNKGLKRAEFARGTVIGVVRDFHSRSLHERIDPLVLKIYPGRINFISVRLGPTGGTVTIAQLKKAWEKVNPFRPFDHFMLSDEFAAMYRSEERTQRLFGWAALLALFIASLGLFGLASFQTAQRTKEIGIRKVLGATVSEITLLLSREFVKWVVIAALIAWPLAYYFMNRWLQGFAYRTTIGVGLFLFSSLLALLIAILTVSFQASRTARANPVDCLRYE